MSVCFLCEPTRDDTDAPPPTMNPQFPQAAGESGEKQKSEERCFLTNLKLKNQEVDAIFLFEKSPPARKPRKSKPPDAPHHDHEGPLVPGPPQSMCLHTSCAREPSKVQECHLCKEPTRPPLLLLPFHPPRAHRRFHPRSATLCSQCHALQSVPRSALGAALSAALSASCGRARDRAPRRRRRREQGAASSVARY